MRDFVCRQERQVPEAKNDRIAKVVAMVTYEIKTGLGQNPGPVW